MSTLEQLTQLRTLAEQKITEASNQQAIDELWTKIFGRKGGELTTILRGVKDIPAEERPEFGRVANEVKAAIEKAFADRRESLYQEEIAKKLNSERLDVTLPGRWAEPGRIHLLSATLRRIKEIFKGLGYSVMSGPEVETDYYNFEALNIPANHPSAKCGTLSSYVKACLCAATLLLTKFALWKSKNRQYVLFALVSATVATPLMPLTSGSSIRWKAFW